MQEGLVRHSTAHTIIVRDLLCSIPHSLGLSMGVERIFRAGGKTRLRRETQLNPNMVIVKQRATTRAANRYYDSPEYSAHA
jgi:uncharacterized protein (DUF1330 family)